MEPGTVRVVFADGKVETYRDAVVEGWPNESSSWLTLHMRTPSNYTNPIVSIDTDHGVVRWSYSHHNDTGAEDAASFVAVTPEVTPKRLWWWRR